MSIKSRNLGCFSSESFTARIKHYHKSWGSRELAHPLEQMDRPVSEVQQTYPEATIAYLRYQIQILMVVPFFFIETRFRFSSNSALSN